MVDGRERPEPCPVRGSFGMRFGREMKGQPIEPPRSALMSRVRRGNTAPELAVRRLVHALGYRFRLHRRDLPGTPDVTLPRLRKIIFVHGCFWHRHPGCSRATTPKTRTAFWQKKFERNVERDRRNIVELESLGWNILVVWECETRNRSRLRGLLSAFLGPQQQGRSGT